jgi:HIP---CoA ligase
MDTVPAVVAEAAERFAGLPAVIDGDTRLSYDELVDQAESFGAALVASGVEKGDRVAIWAFNSVEWVISVLGLLEAGAVVAPINTRFKGPEAADILRRSRSRVLVTVTEFLGTNHVELLRRTGIELPHLKTTVVIRGLVPEGAEGWQTFLGRAGDGARAELARRSSSVTADDPSDLLFTSGTTGVPKGVVMTHRRTLCVATDWVAMTGLSSEDRYLMVNPYFHMFGLKAGILACLAAGSAMLPEPTFDVTRVLGRAQRERVTVLPGPPTLYQSILDHPDLGSYDLSSLRMAVTGAADIPVELIRRVDEELPFSTLISGYGLTEGGTATSTEPGDELEAIATTVGRPRPGFEIRLVDERGRDVPPGGIGEIWIRGGSVMSHYLDDPEATARALSPDGWLATGDLGRFDDAGRLRIVGRLKDMFIVGGFNVYPAEVENLLLGHPDLQQAAVVGIPDDRLGEVGMAFVVTRPGASVTGSDIVGWSREQMANYKAPRVVEVVDELPVNATGKVHKDLLRELATSRRPISPV